MRKWWQALASMFHVKQTSEPLPEELVDPPGDLPNLPPELSADQLALARAARLKVAANQRAMMGMR